LVLLAAQAVAANAIAEIRAAEMKSYALRHVPEHTHDLSIGLRVGMTMLVWIAGSVSLCPDRTVG
jgi:hypothetical protein